MFHLFTDQCREAYKGQGWAGILSLWARILIDVSVTAIREHLSTPRASVGLLDIAPNAVLPWKGVLLVLVPGLIFFVSQIEQVTSSNDWFFLVFYRAGYFLILPVLLVWLLTRRFPVWGLIPLGLLYETLWSYGQLTPLSRLPFIGRWFVGESVNLFGMRINTYDLRYLLAASVCVILLGTLIGYNIRRRQIPLGAWKWLGLCGLLIVFRMAGEVYRFGVLQSQYLSPEELWAYLFPITLWYLYDSLPFLVLVFIGMLFARKYGGFSFLLLLGYLLPTIIFGRYGAWNEYVPFYLVSAAVLVYRFVVALVAPIWLVRAASTPGRQRAAAIPVGVAIATHISLNLISFLAVVSQNNYQPSLLDVVMTIWNQLIISAGLGLAVSLYLPRNNDRVIVSPPDLVSAAE